MNTIKTDWAIGNFALSLESEVSDAVFQIAANYGLRWLGQRQTEVDKVLGAFEPGADGKLKRKEGWKRGDVDFTPDIARKLEQVFEAMEFEEGEEKFPVVCAVDAKEYIREKAAPKFVDEKAVMTRHEKAGDLKEFMAGKIGYAGELKGEDGDWHLDALRAIRAFVKSM